MILVALCLLGAVEPITPGPLREALQAAPTGAEAEALAERIRAAYPDHPDLRNGEPPPLIEGNRVAFAIEAPRSATPRLVGVPGDPALVRIGATRLWAAVATVPNGAKFTYYYRVGTRRLGRRTVEMPGWAGPAEAKPRPGPAYGSYEPIAITSPKTGRSRAGWVYVPPTVGDASGPLALIVFLDGDAYRRIGAGTIAENLMRDGALPPVVLVGIEPAVGRDGLQDRAEEYRADDEGLVAAIEDEVFAALPELPYREDAAGRAIVGASLGARAAVRAAWSRPEVFGRVLAQLGRFDGQPALLPRVQEAKAPKPIRFVFTALRDDPDAARARALRDLIAALKGRSDAVTLIEGDGLPNFWAAQRLLPEALRQLWADEAKPPADAQPPAPPDSADR